MTYTIGIDVGGTYIDACFRMLCHTMPRNDSNGIKPPSRRNAA